MTIVAATGSDKKVKVSGTDGKTDFLGNKIVAGTDIVVTILTAAGVETVEIKSTAAAGAAADFHAGFNLIATSTTSTVTAGKNMVSYGLDIEGELDVEGYLVVEA